MDNGQAGNRISNTMILQGKMIGKNNQKMKMPKVAVAYA